MFLLDSSVIAITIQRFREKAVEVICGKTTLDLSRYELGNIIWKKYALKDPCKSKRSHF